MSALRKIERNDLQALKITDLRGQVTNFNLYLDRGGDIIPYALGRHTWSLDEKADLLQNGQFILLYAKEDEAVVKSYLQEGASPAVDAFVANDAAKLLIPDGMAEFLKTRYSLPFNAEQYTFFKGLALALAQYLQAQTQTHKILQQLNQHDSYTFYHSCRVSAYAVAMCIEHCGDNHARLWDVAMGSLLHDVGYLSLSAELLQRESSLEEKEWQQVRRHPEEGMRVLQNVPLSTITRDMIMHHHERYDGGGYPHRLVSKDLALEVRILSFAEVFAALTAPRNYQKARTPTEALNLIESGLMSFLDPQLLPVLKALLGVAPSKQRAV